VSRSLKLLALVMVVVGIVALSRHGIHQGSTATTTSSSTSPVTTSATTPACQGSDFTAVDNGGAGAAGTAYDSITLTKVTTGACTVNGYPLLTMSSATGTVVPETVTDNKASGGVMFPVAAANDSVASFTITKGSTIGLSYSFNDMGGSCPSVKTVNVQFAAQGSSAPVTLRYDQAPCGGAVTVSPFYLVH